MLALFLILFPFFVLSEDLSLDGSEDIAKIHFMAPNIPKDAYLVMYFNSPSDLSQKLIVSQARKDGIDESLSKYDGIWSVEVPETSAIEGDYALVLKSQAKHHAVSMKLDKPIKFDTKEVVIQYEVKYQDKIDCGGAYIKLLSSPIDLKNFNDITPYTIMFGPDKCGLDDKFHLIIRYRNPKSGVIEEKHAKKITSSLEQYFSDKRSHLYTLVLRSDNSFERYIDQVLVQTGNFLTDLEPPINPPTEIDDPADKKPVGWDDREEIVDETATKPNDWDENAPELINDKSVIKPDGWLDDVPAMIPDSSAKPPVDWDQEMDGKWDAPEIKNPKCENAPGCGEWKSPLIRNPMFKGKWHPPLIQNPAYKGVWKAKKILNPDYFEDKDPLKNLAEINALGLELWSMTSEVAFDNFLIVDSKRVADDFAAQTWSVKQKAEKLADPKSKSVFDAVQETYNEKPWLIFVIGLVCTLPIILCCIYFCRSPKRTSVIHKKTDEFTPINHVKNSPKSTDEELDESIEDDIISVSKGSGDDSDAQLRSTGDDSTEDGVGAENEESLKSKQNLRKRRSRKE